MTASDLAPILVVHGLLDTSRETNIDFSMAIPQWPHGHTVHVHNIFAPLTDATLQRSYSLLVVTYEVAALRTLPEWHWTKTRIQRLRNICQRAALFIQDDYTAPALIDDLVVRLDFDTVFSPLAQYAEIFYPRSTRKGVHVCHTLTGYVHPVRAELQHRLSTPLHARSIDLGQRVRQPPTSLGRGAAKKFTFATELASAARDGGLRVDVEVADGRPLLGDNWWSFLRATRFVPGARGGATAADLDGRATEREARNELLRALGLPWFMRPQAGRRLARGDFRAVGPRLFEAAMTGTCQILIEDEYLPELLPDLHYMSIPDAASALPKAVRRMRDLDTAEEMAVATRRAIVVPDTYHYPTAVRAWLKELGLSTVESPSAGIVVDEQQPLRGFLSLSPREKLRVRELSMGMLPPWPGLRRRRRRPDIFPRMSRSLSPKRESDWASGIDILVSVALQAGPVEPECLIWPWTSPLASASWLHSIAHGTCLGGSGGTSSN